MSNSHRLVKPLSPSNKGAVLITALLVLLLLTFVALSLADLTLAQSSRTHKGLYTANSLLAAEAGIEQSLHELNTDSNFTGLPETVFFNDETKGRATYQSTVSEGSGPNEKIITSTGRVYRYNQTSDPISERKVRVTVVGTSTEDYSVYAGPGGLILKGNAAITNSDVYVNGTISLNGNATIGTSANPKNVKVAHQACPTGSNPGSEYPRVCTSGEPISFSGNNTRIYGSVCATNQTASSHIRTGSGGAGLMPNCVAPPVSMPVYDRSAHIADVDITANASQYACNSNRNWPANLRLNGSVNLRGNCDITIGGNVYITGDLDLSGNTTITIDDSVNETRPVIIVDGSITFTGNSTLVPNSSGTGAHFISFKSAAGCSPNCENVTGTDLKNSQNLTTVNVNSNGSFPGVLFQSYWSKLEMKSNGVAGSAIGQTVELSGNGTIVFGTTLSSGESTWTIRSYQQDFN